MAEGITIARVFDVPRERVWKEWTEPEAFADWFGGGESDVPLSSVSMHEPAAKMAAQTAAISRT